MTYAQKIDDAIRQLQDAQDAVLAAQKAQSDLKERLVEELAPYGVGDEVVCNGDSFKGRRMVIEHVRLRKWLRGYEWYCEGPVLKQDGTPGKNRGECTIRLTDRENQP